MPARVIVAARDMSAERRRAAALDGRHCLHLAKADVTRISKTPSGAMIAEDVRDLQSWTCHRRRLLRRRGILISLGAPAVRCSQIVQRALDLGDHAGRHA